MSPNLEMLIPAVCRGQILRIENMTRALRKRVNNRLVIDLCEYKRNNWHPKYFIASNVIQKRFQYLQNAIPRSIYTFLE